MKLFITHCFFFFFVSVAFSQAQNVWLKGSIKNYPAQPIYIYQCHTDTLLLVDSTHTNKKGEFALDLPNGDGKGGAGMYKAVLQRNQWFYILNDGKPIEIKTVYISDVFYNWASDSLEVVLSDENKLFYEFQRIQKKVVVGNFVLREMLRLFPYYDDYRNEMEKEYNGRYAEMDKLLQKANKEYPDHQATKIIRAYYTPNPDWQQPDNWRDSIIAAHYFDYFNPADSFYLNTNILPEKIDNYFNLFSFLLRVNRETHSDYEQHIIKAADEFLKHTASNPAFPLPNGEGRGGAFGFCLQYILKKSDKEKMYDALFSVYDKWVYQAAAGDCEQTNPALNKWREKVSVLRNIQTGSIAPDFEIEKGKLSLSSLQSNYTLVLFWASWCPHCTQEIPKIKKAVDAFNSKLITVAVSLDTDSEQWQKFITENNLLSFLNFSELKGWNGEVSKKYNVYATPTMFLLDKDKKIIAKPETAEQLGKILSQK